MVLDISNKAISWNAQDQRFSAYLSDLNNTELSNKCWHHKPITVKNPKTGVEVMMTWLKDDKDGSDEDTYGFNYIGYNKGTRRHFTFTFINS